jgi:hypothetical protein
MVDFTFSCNPWGGASFIVTTGFAAWEGLSWQEFHNLTSVQMQLYEVLFKQSIREALFGAGIAEPEAAGLVEADDTEYLFLLGEFGGACFRTYEDRWAIFVAAVSQVVRAINYLKGFLESTDCTVRLLTPSLPLF